ncbi:hypothetical protein BER93_05530 [Xanthomonas fragariae]|nr:hypothetical protein BER92_05525 [Xanthomonas fragariae]AOD17676.1 hypothetical protein BER93_05530 [Xanthomonas fragariae]ENZ94557.1 hypothetical protein O1K_15174 [Xanthomonas fragariae LMG 25863]
MFTRTGHDQFKGCLLTEPVFHTGQRFTWKALNRGDVWIGKNARHFNFAKDTAWLSVAHDGMNLTYGCICKPSRRICPRTLRRVVKPLCGRPTMRPVYQLTRRNFVDVGERGIELTGIKKLRCLTFIDNPDVFARIDHRPNDISRPDVFRCRATVKNSDLA